MDYNLRQILFLLGFVVVFGDIVALYNLGIVLWLIIGVMVFLFINFFLNDLILDWLKDLLIHRIRRRKW